MEAWLSCSYDLIASSTTCLWCWGVWSREFLPHPCYHRTDEKWVQLSYAHNFRAYSPTSSITGLALLCFPAEVQGLFVQDLQLSGTDSHSYEHKSSSPNYFWHWCGEGHLSPVYATVWWMRGGATFHNFGPKSSIFSPRGLALFWWPEEVQGPFSSVF